MRDDKEEDDLAASRKRDRQGHEAATKDEQAALEADALRAQQQRAKLELQRLSAEEEASEPSRGAPPPAMSDSKKEKEFWSASPWSAHQGGTEDRRFLSHEQDDAPSTELASLDAAQQNV